MGEVNSYFEYALSLCEIQEIESVCQVVSSQKELKQLASEDFRGLKKVFADWRLIRAVQDCLEDYSIINPIIMNNDANKVYKRCQAFFLTEHERYYNEIFDRLVDLNWLLASVQYGKRDANRHIILISNYSVLLNNIRAYLFDLYNSAIVDYNECVYIDEALKAREKWFPEYSYNFQYEESKKYINRERYYTADLEDLKVKNKERGVSKMALFFGLTATAALADYVRRCAR